MVKKLSKTFLLLLVALFTILIASCGANNDDTPTPEVENDNAGTQTESEEDSSESTEVVEDTLEDEFVDDSEEEVEIGELI